jgi:hypothetical protein
MSMKNEKMKSQKVLGGTGYAQGARLEKAAANARSIGTKPGSKKKSTPTLKNIKPAMPKAGPIAKIAMKAKGK